VLFVLKKRAAIFFFFGEVGKKSATRAGLGDLFVWKLQQSQEPKEPQLPRARASVISTRAAFASPVSLSDLINNYER